MAAKPVVRKSTQQRKVPLVALSLITIFLGFPSAVQAGISMAADAMCNPVQTVCGCQMVMGQYGCTNGSNMFMCPCWDTPPGGKITGICVANNNCEGKSTEKGGLGDMQSMMDILKSVMDALKKKEDSGSGEQPTPQDKAGCTQTYTVSAPTSDPCANYIPLVSSTLFDESASGTNSGASRDLLNALNVGINAAFGIESPASADNTSSATVTNTSQTEGAQPLSGQATDVGAQPPREGTYGDIVTTDTGGTIYAGSRDVGQNVEVAGFFGAGSLVGKIQTAVAGMCQARPWANSLVARLIPEKFFDGLCSWRGYEVGTPVPPPPIPTTPQAVPKSETSPTSSPSPQTQTTGEPKVDIWAVPGSVSLGLRASIFWNTKNVDSCTINSSGGNFNENKLSGGAATVPLTNDTTFTISCIAPAGITLTDQVTVTISP